MKIKKHRQILIKEKILFEALIRLGVGILNYFLQIVRKELY